MSSHWSWGTTIGVDWGTSDRPRIGPILGRTLRKAPKCLKVTPAGLAKRGTSPPAGLRHDKAILVHY